MAVDFLISCRSRLLSVDCPWVVQMSDSELETWLFEPGPQHIKALIWALTKIDPSLGKHFLVIDEKDTEKEVVRLFACCGLVKSTETDKVLGRSSRKVLESFWDSVLKQMCLLQEYENESQGHYCDNALSFVSALMSSSDFWDLLEKKPSLLPADIMLPHLTVTFEDLKYQLANAEERLADAQEKSSIICNETQSLGCASSLEEVQVQKNLREVIALQKNTIDDCYKRFLEQIVTVIKKRPPNPIAEQLAQIVVKLHVDVKEFNQFLENAVEMKRLETLFSSLTLPDDSITKKNVFNEFVSTMTQKLSMINGIINANKDVFGL